MRQLFLALSGLLLFAGPAFAQLPVTVTQYPRMHFTEPELGTGGTGQTSSATFVDILAGSDEANKFFVSDIWWWEKGDKPCNLTVTFSSIDNRQRKFQVPVNRCANSRGLKRFVIENTSMRRGGMPSSLGVCLRNNRIKGLKAELIEIQGELENFTFNGIPAKRFIPLGGPGFVEVGSPLGTVAGGAPGERLMNEVSKKRTNCRKKDWQPFASCNPGNASFSKVVTGFRLFLSGSTFEGLIPFCSSVRVSG